MRTELLNLLESVLDMVEETKKVSLKKHKFRKNADGTKERTYRWGAKHVGVWRIVSGRPIFVRDKAMTQEYQDKKKAKAAKRKASNEDYSTSGLVSLFEAKGLFYQDVMDALARVLYVMEWANEVEEQGGRLGQGDLFDMAPNTSPAAKKYAAKLIKNIEQLNGKSIDQLVQSAADADGRDPSARYAEQFGHALGYMHVGAGVSWWDDHEKFPLKVPSGEAYGLVSQRDVKRYVREDTFCEAQKKTTLTFDPELLSAAKQEVEQRFKQDPHLRIIYNVDAILRDVAKLYYQASDYDERVRLLNVMQPGFKAVSTKELYPRLAKLLKKERKWAEQLLVVSEAVDVNFTGSKEVGHIRVTNHGGGAGVTDLTNAGKRGKTVEYFSMSLPRSGNGSDYWGWLAYTLETGDFKKSLQKAEEIAAENKLVYLTKSKKKGIEVAPSQEQPVVFDTPSVFARFDRNGFRVQDSKDYQNEMTLIPRNATPTRMTKLLKDLRSDMVKFEKLDFHGWYKFLADYGFSVHSYAAMD